MSYGVVAAVMVAIAGVATVHAFAPPSGPARTTANLERQGEPAQLSAARAPGTLASFEANRRPVPILLTHRAPAGPIAGAPSHAVSTDDGAISSENSAARAAIERDGYKGVHSLRRRPDGLWSGRALRGSSEIEVTVDAAGNVAAD